MKAIISSTILLLLVITIKAQTKVPIRTTDPVTHDYVRVKTPPIKTGDQTATHQIQSTKMPIKSGGQTSTPKPISYQNEKLPSQTTQTATLPQLPQVTPPSTQGSEPTTNRQASGQVKKN
ncbi:hypothetical protein DVR12_16275 [Chitinophaga silvatica]|uniref:Uncharacterized protein n=1 Tax=Chitinophaga silvatica TaxID=2282649 RepID=A0A3E1Y754_9BACT|nr:hypothetical protein [Chitinophaga silvatica]RFS20909.1 hypothetical protein DVR12_16275 [Chitinophaga silvatica]